MSQDTKPIQLTRRPGQEYTDEEIDRGLTALVLCRGNTLRAAAELDKAGFPIPRGTLEQWKNRTRRERYLEIDRRETPGLKLDLAEKCQAFADQLLDALAENTALTAEKLKDTDISFKERAQGGYYMTTQAGIALQNAAQLRGDPSTIIEHRTVHETLNGLKRLGVVESTATELSDLPDVPARSDAQHA